MDEITQEIKKYVDDLVPAAKTAVLSPEWRRRVGEIGQKYSLRPDQIESLEHEVFFVMVGIESDEDLPQNLEKEVGVSNIISGQIIDDVNTRVFQYIAKLVENGDKKIETSAINLAATPKQNPIETPIKTAASPIANLTPQPSHHTAPPPVNLPSQEDPMDMQEKNIAPNKTETLDDSDIQWTAIPFKDQPNKAVNVPPTKPHQEWNNDITWNQALEQTQPPLQQTMPSSFLPQQLNEFGEPLSTNAHQPVPTPAPTPLSAQPQVVQQNQNPITHTYATDPYREPTE
jgi:hypothetical protein